MERVEDTRDLFVFFLLRVEGVSFASFVSLSFSFVSLSFSLSFVSLSFSLSFSFSFSLLVSFSL